MCDEKFSRLAEEIEKTKDKKGASIIILQEAQKIFGYLTKEILEFISAKSGLSVQSLFEVASYYPQFKLSKTAKHKISVCMGTACYICGAGEILEALKNSLNICEGEVSADGKFSLDTVRCLGCCALAPVMMIDNELFSKLTPKQALEELENFKKRQQS